MKTLEINQQKSSDLTWLDESGLQIPFKRISPSERKREKDLANLARKALGLNSNLIAFKRHLIEIVDQLYTDFLQENNGKIGKNKGNVTLFNFDRSIKVVIKVSDRIELDQNFITLAKAELDALVQTSSADAQDFIKAILQTAFETSGGNLDYKKVLTLKKHSKRFKNENWDRAMDFIDKAISKPSSRDYQQIWVKDGKGEYQNIQLNFASLETED